MARAIEAAVELEAETAPAARREAMEAPPVTSGPESVAAVLALQRSAGNSAVARSLRGRTLSRLVSGNYAGLFDFDKLAQQIYLGIARAGTDEQAVFHALERLQRDGAAIAQLKTAYAQYGDLEAHLRDDFSGSELNYALQLINAGGAGGTETIGAAPASDADHEHAAERIRDAVVGFGTDEEAIYAVLMAYGRNSGLITRLKEAYHSAYGEDLRDRLFDELTTEEFEHAAYLMGESALEETEVSPAEAARIFTVMSTLTFTDTAGTQSPVPYHYPVDGCYARAHMMAQVLTRAGYASERVFATSTTGGLEIPNQYSEDQPGGAPPVTRWFYHVAPIINVRTAAGVEQQVIDPSTQAGPVPIATWLGAMGVAPASYQRLTHDQLMAHLAAAPPGPNVGGFPMGEQLVWTTDRNTMYPGEGPEDDSQRADAELEGLTPTMTDYAGRAATHEVAAAVRAELANPAATGMSVIRVIRAQPVAARAALWTRFPTMHSEVVARFPGARSALAAAVGP